MGVIGLAVSPIDLCSITPLGRLSVGHEGSPGTGAVFPIKNYLKSAVGGLVGKRRSRASCLKTMVSFGAILKELFNMTSAGIVACRYF